MDSFQLLAASYELAAAEMKSVALRIANGEEVSARRGPLGNY